MSPLGHSRRRPRLLLAAAAVAAAVALAGCDTEGIDMAKAMKPLSAEMVSLLEAKGMDKTAPILVRVFKEEAELEIWKQNRDGQYALLKTYPICRWSGELGPKVREGDRQAPEGFYTITPTQMNPRSQYYLSFNLGYPNAYDKSHGRTGAHLMVHGDCSSAGCYSMTDEQIQEIYSLGREAFFGGQKSFQVQAYPFHMTALNMAKHRNSPHMAFWKMLKEGNDHFEVARAEPKVDVCEKRYVFNAGEPANMTPGKPLRFDASGRCPAYEVPPEIAAEVTEKTKRDELAFADYVRRGTPTVPIKMGQDGGMHPSFMAALNPQQVRDANGNVRWMVEPPKIGSRRAPVIANHDPRLPEQAAPTTVASIPTGGAVPMPRPAPRRATAVASGGSGAAAYANSGDAREGGTVFGGILSRTGEAASSVARVLGLADEPKSAPRATPARRSAAAAKPVVHPTAHRAEPPKAVAAKPAPAAKPQQTAQASAAPSKPAGKPAAAGSLMPGAQPVMQTGGFESRWSGTPR